MEFFPQHRRKRTYTEHSSTPYRRRHFPNKKTTNHKSNHHHSISSFEIMPSQQLPGNEAQGTPEPSSNTGFPKPSNAPIGIHRKEGESSLQDICLMRSTQVCHTVF